MVKRLIVPGLEGSGEGHWQRWWLTQDPDARIVEQDDWRPDLRRWLYRIAVQVRLHPGAVIVGHSLGALLVPHLVLRYPQLEIRGALMVAPADVDENPMLREMAKGFSPIPVNSLPFPSIVVGSTNDPSMTIERVTHLAHAWRSRFYHLGDSGHINAASGYGAWPGGLKLAAQLLNPLGAPNFHSVADVVGRPPFSKRRRPLDATDVLSRCAERIVRGLVLTGGSLGK